MRRFFILITLTLWQGIIFAQYLPSNNQAYQLASVYNPAFTGTESFGDLKLGYRYQWTSFGADAPKFINVLYNFRLSKPRDLKHNALRTSASENRLPKNKRIIHAMGGNLFNEEVGVIKRFGGGLNYSFHYPLFENKNVWLATGISSVFDNTRIDISGIYLGSNPDPDSYYEKLLSNGANRVDINIRAGMLLYAPHFYFGFSYLPIWSHPIQSAEENISSSFYRGTIQAGAAFPISQAFNLKPSIFGVWQMNNELLIDYSLKVYYDERVWLGFAYRSTSSGVGLIGLDLSKLLAVTYSYEVPTNAFQQFSNGSHELLLAIRLNNFRGYNSYMW